MEKIDWLGGASAFLPSDRKKVKEKTTSRVRFSGIVDAAGDEKKVEAEEAASREAADEAVEKMLDSIHTLGEALARDATPENVRGYKSAIQRFMRHVVSNGLDVEEKVSGFNILKRKKYHLVKVIDEKLDKLAAGVLEHQRNQLDLLERIEEIQGLLIDLVR